MECARNAMVDQKEKWWVTVMEVGLDPELSKVVH